MKWSNRALLAGFTVVGVTALVYRHQAKKQKEDFRIRRLERKRKRRAAEKDKTAVAVT